MNEFLFILWYFLPAGVANMAPVFVYKLPYLKDWNYPLDGFRRYRGKRIFGDHKTMRGLLVGILFAIVTSWIQHVLFFNNSFIGEFVPSTFASISPLSFGFLSGAGALLGDAGKSFFKRQLNIPSGKSWLPFDQLDYIIGGAILTAFLFPLSIGEYGLLFIIFFILHLFVSWCGYQLKLKKDPI